MGELRATARAGANIALIKYWGTRDPALNLPLNDSLSLTLSDAVTVTTVAYDPDLHVDEVYLDGERVLDDRATRVSRQLDRVRVDYYRMYARVASVNSFPAGTGLASSASGFAALTVAAIAAFDEGLPTDRELSARARRGSGSAARSIPGGFVHWRAGRIDEDSFAESVFEPDWWDLRDLCPLISTSSKEVSSARGHRIAAVHPFMEARLRALPGRLAAVQGAIADRDLDTLGTLVEHEALEMHGIMISSTPSCLYLLPGTLAVIHAVRHWREDGLGVYVTLDAGPNPHLLCLPRDESQVLEAIERLLPGTRVIANRPGPGTTLVREHLL
jgi:diphosphomevalonate decarboxylase